MKKQVLLCFCCALLPFTSSFTEKCQKNHFTIHTDLNPLYVQFVQANAEAFYQNLQQRYFQTPWEEPLIIYYSETGSETLKLIKLQGHKDEAASGQYIASVPAVYAHRITNDGQPCGWSTLFHEITHHFIHQNFQNPPEWFNEGLASFLGEQTRIIKGKLTIACPDPKLGLMLKSTIEEGRRLSIRRLLSTSKESFYRWSVGPQFAQTFFYWLNDIGQLEQYLKNTQQKNYELSVLEKTLSRPYGKINTELAAFIKKNCYAPAYLEEGRQAKNKAQKELALLKALEIKPDYHAARLDLAKCYNRNKDYKKCRDYLKQILDTPESCHHRQAATLMGNTYYNQKDYLSALEYYIIAWEYSDLHEDKYRVAYQIGNSYYYLQDPENAKQWYQKFLDCNWEPKQMEAATNYAQKYIELTHTADDAEKGDNKEITNDNTEKKM